MYSKLGFQQNRCLDLKYPQIWVLLNPGQLILQINHYFHHWKLIIHWKGIALVIRLSVWPVLKVTFSDLAHSSWLSVSVSSHCLSAWCYLPSGTSWSLSNILFFLNQKAQMMSFSIRIFSPHHNSIIQYHMPTFYHHIWKTKLLKREWMPRRAEAL